jgi:hypothetical protein
MTTRMSNDLNLFIVMKIQRGVFESRSSPFRGEEGRFKDKIGRFRGMKGSRPSESKSYAYKAVSMYIIIVSAEWP